MDFPKGFGSKHLEKIDTKWLFSFASLCALALGLVLFDIYHYQLTKTTAVLFAFLALVAGLFGITGDKKQWRKTLNEPVLWAFLGYLFLSFITIVYILEIGGLEAYLIHYLGHLLLLFGAVWLYVNLQSNRWFLDNFTKVIFWGVWVYLALLMVTIYNNLYYLTFLDRFFYNHRVGVYNFIKLVPVLLASRLWLQRDNPSYKTYKDWFVYLVLAVVFLCTARLLKNIDFIPSDISWVFRPYVLAGYGLLFGYRFLKIRSSKPFYKDIWLWIILGFFLLQLRLINFEHGFFASYQEAKARLGLPGGGSEAIIFPIGLGFLAMVAYWVRLLVGKRFGKIVPWFGILGAFLGVYIFYLGMGDITFLVMKENLIYQFTGVRETLIRCSLLSTFNDIFYIKPHDKLYFPCNRWLFGYLGPEINYHGYITEGLHRNGLLGILLLGLGFILPFVYWLNRAEQKGAWVALLAIIISFSFLISTVEEDKNFAKYRELMYGLSIYPMVITLAIIHNLNKYSKRQIDEN